MVEQIIEFSARNRFIVFLLVSAFSVVGLWAMWQTPIDALPDISDTQVIVYTTWPGRSPDLVEDQIDLAPLNGSRSYVWVGPKGGPYATFASHRRTDSRQAA